MTVIYGLRHERTGRVYIGCTSGKLSKRMREHRCLLRQGRHASRQLQKLWDAEGESGFRLVVLESLSREASVIEKRERELAQMRFYQSGGLLLNDNLTSFSPPAGAQAKSRRALGKTQSSESNEKRRLAQLGRPKGHGAKISATKQAKKLLRDSLLSRE